MNDQYVPGVCNINPREVAYRRKVAIISGVLTLVLYLSTTLIIQLPTYARVIVVILPLLITFISIFQVRQKFCVSYGTSGLQHVSSETAEVQDQTARDLDRATSRRILIKAGLVAIAVLFAIELVLYFI